MAFRKQARGLETPPVVHRRLNTLARPSTRSHVILSDHLFVRSSYQRRSIRVLSNFSPPQVRPHHHSRSQRSADPPSGAIMQFRPARFQQTGNFCFVLALRMDNIMSRPWLQLALVHAPCDAFKALPRRCLPGSWVELLATRSTRGMRQGSFLRRCHSALIRLRFARKVGHDGEKLIGDERRIWRWPLRVACCDERCQGHRQPQA